MTSRNASEDILSETKLDEAFETYMDREWSGEDGGVHWREWRDEDRWICREVFKAGAKFING